MNVTAYDMTHLHDNNIFTFYYSKQDLRVLFSLVSVCTILLIWCILCKLCGAENLSTQGDQVPGNFRISQLARKPGIIFQKPGIVMKIRQTSYLYGYFYEFRQKYATTMKRKKLGFMMQRIKVLDRFSLQPRKIFSEKWSPPTSLFGHNVKQSSSLMTWSHSNVTYINIFGYCIRSREHFGREYA